MNTVKEILEEELALVEAYIKFLDRRRNGAGLLYIPDELVTGSEYLDEDDSVSFEKELMEALMQPIADHTSAAAIVPIIIRGPAELYDKVGYIDLDKDLYAVLTSRAYKLKAQIEELDTDE